MDAGVSSWIGSDWVGLGVTAAGSGSGSGSGSGEGEKERREDGKKGRRIRIGIRIGGKVQQLSVWVDDRRAR